MYEFIVWPANIKSFINCDKHWEMKKNIYVPTRADTFTFSLDVNVKSSQDELHKFTGKKKIIIVRFEPPHDKSNKMAYAPSEDSDQTGHPDQSLRCPHEESLGP